MPELTPYIYGIMSRNEASSTGYVNQPGTLSTELVVGQLVILALMPGAQGTLYTLDTYTRDLIRTLQPGGVILYAYNLRDPVQVARLIQEINDLCMIRPFIALDEEGGRVSRFKSSITLGATVTPPARDLAKDGGPAVTGAYTIIGQEMRALGFSMNFAPVLDLDVFPDLVYLGDRSFGRDPKTVGYLGVLAQNALQSEGIVAVGKHFPGHGRTKTDTHAGLAIVDASWDELQEDLLPFAMTMATGMDAIMTAHVIYPNLGSQDLPASLDPLIINKLARQEMGFKGLIITDSLTMGGVLGSSPEEDLAVQALTSGADMVLSPRDPLRVYRYLQEVYKKNQEFRWRVDEALDTILLVKSRYHIFKAPRLDWSDSDLQLFFDGIPSE